MMVSVLSRMQLKMVSCLYDDLVEQSWFLGNQPVPHKPEDKPNRKLNSNPNLREEWVGTFPRLSLGLKCCKIQNVLDFLSHL